ncbi:16S rRNA (uracil(1498)-N(3))-methyltransferase [Pseudoclavibacter sp. 13-3]|uniref:16S rRNA (uracil(1498)-N(3))-methyltransferase n=1 Tax=Pseudoclavibacter sp. 13-3 TaxID=2901228 RepID=UPI001E59166F|nr:16S rRNA (uracil(1498)-N(3))-methyltransferase [Pseudoclavibacter sp. 13-3]MCD7100610.1 16S rRNA (uracil(1498)-N(3))-methyltransferase [Pseudoclavibacter sp. 13-3]
MPLFLPERLLRLELPADSDEHTVSRTLAQLPVQAFHDAAAASAWQAQTGDFVAFAGAEAHHATAVRRLNRGEPVSVADGTGLELVGTIAATTKSSLALRVALRRTHELPTPSLTLVQALAKGGRDELAIQSATEAGVDAVVPWQAQRSVSVWQGRKLATGQQRWAAVVREAAKQSLRARVPEVGVPVTTPQLAAALSGAGAEALEGRLALLLDPEAPERLTTVPLERATNAERGEVVVIIGPEGGTDPAERDRLVKAGVIPVRLGESVLRTSSAGLAAISVLSGRLGRW